jgi:hypothetical protein
MKIVLIDEFCNYSCYLHLGVFLAAKQSVIPISVYIYCMNTWSNTVVTLYLCSHDWIALFDLEFHFGSRRHFMFTHKVPREAPKWLFTCHSFNFFYTGHKNVFSLKIL